MLQIILSLVAGFVPVILKLVLNGTASAEEATVLHNVALDITQADAATSGGTWTFTASKAAAPSAAVKK